MRRERGTSGGDPQVRVHVRRDGSSAVILVRVDDIDALLAHQCGVIARRQVEGCGETAADIARRLRRREWVRLLPGVYVDHTGTPAWTQRAWAGVLYYAPAVIADESALAARPEADAPVVLAVDRHRNVRARPGYVIRWVTDVEATSLTNTSPPRMRVEDAALRTASRCDRDLDAVETLAAVIQRRLTTASRVDAAMLRHPRLPRRAWLGEVLADVAAGSHSVLEREFLARVERAHALPTAVRQLRRVTTRVRYADAGYPEYGMNVELESRLFHNSPEQWHRDLERDFEAAVAGQVTIRIGWGQVFDGACRTAARLGELFKRRGWSGSPAPCGPGCLLA